MQVTYTRISLHYTLYLGSVHSLSSVFSNLKDIKYLVIQLLQMVHFRQVLHVTTSLTISFSITLTWSSPWNSPSVAKSKSFSPPPSFLYMYSLPLWYIGDCSRVLHFLHIRAQHSPCTGAGVWRKVQHLRWHFDKWPLSILSSKSIHSNTRFRFPNKMKQRSRCYVTTTFIVMSPKI